MSATDVIFNGGCFGDCFELQDFSAIYSPSHTLKTFFFVRLMRNWKSTTPTVSFLNITASHAAHLSKKRSLQTNLWPLSKDKFASLFISRTNQQPLNSY